MHSDLKREGKWNVEVCTTSCGILRNMLLLRKSMNMMLCCHFMSFQYFTTVRYSTMRIFCWILQTMSHIDHSISQRLLSALAAPTWMGLSSLYLTVSLEALISLFQQLNAGCVPWTRRKSKEDSDSPQRTSQQMLSASQLQSLAHGLFPPDEGTDCLVETERVFFWRKLVRPRFLWMWLLCVGIRDVYRLSMPCVSLARLVALIHIWNAKLSLPPFHRSQDPPANSKKRCADNNPFSMAKFENWHFLTFLMEGVTSRALFLCHRKAVGFPQCRHAVRGRWWGLRFERSRVLRAVFCNLSSCSPVVVKPYSAAMGYLFSLYIYIYMICIHRGGYLFLDKLKSL